MTFEKWLISVLICTYNAESTIKNTLESCLNQTYTNFEILIHDDQSKDKTLNIINEINDNRIKVIESWKKLWPYKWLNFLLDHAKWEYIAIQDHDDIRHSKKLEKQISFLDNNKKYIWCWSWFIEYYSKQKAWILVNIEWWETNFVAHTSLMFRNWEYRYDENNDFIWDAYFEIRELTKWKKIIYCLPEILIVHYNKESWWNYSDQWFRINMKNFSRYMEVYKNNLRMVLIYIFFTFLYFVWWTKLKNKAERFILKNIHKKMSFNELCNYNENAKELMKYYI